jgi:acetamidase/formamidase
VALHELPLDAAFLHGYFSQELEPVLEIEPGDSVRFSVPNAGWDLSADERFQASNPDLDKGHALAGPIAVRGARAGQTLAVRVDDVEVGAWGVTVSVDDHAVHWELADGVGRALGRELDLAPFLGVIGMPPPIPGVHSTIPPRRWGGNIDCKELVAGATLFLPVPVDGALFSAGDGHAAQGDGEICGTAIEAPVTAQVTLDVRDDLALDWPIARTEEAWLTFGFDETLDGAAQIAVDSMIALMQQELELGPGDALALASVGVDVRVTQLVNGLVGVHAVLRDHAFR